ncbi:uncharacterized protein LOC127722352 [Mytilus californianus]|uniref:uncharacterized protein LOC127722352 n=1 Tax=Mytilus californianus TaxID=6549 RepID=UPI0022473B1E|nr:uncharacterized protein LOC127722352 [Mytilus californianus]
MVPCSPCFSPATYPSEDYVDEMNPDAADINSSLQIYSSEISSTQSSQSSTQSSQLTSTDSWKPPTYTRDKLNRSMDILSNGNFKPLRYSLTRPLSNTHQSTSDYITQKANECVQYLFECIAPNQTDELMKLVFKKYYSSKTENKVEADALTQAVVKAYTKADGHQSQIQILSLIVNDFKKTDLWRYSRLVVSIHVIEGCFVKN